jgi:hypothetical protein
MTDWMSDSLIVITFTGFAPFGAFRSLPDMNRWTASANNEKPGSLSQRLRGY